MEKIQPGDELLPHEYWNNSERPARRLRVPTVVLNMTSKMKCQSGLMLQVEFRNGDRVWLDAGWFKQPRV